MFVAGVAAAVRAWLRVQPRQIVGKLNERASDLEVSELVDFAVPVQKRHFETVRAGSLEIAGREDPDAIA